MMKKKRIEDIENVPNVLTIFRFLMAFAIFFLIIFKVDLRLIIILFGIAAITDGIDGFLARRYKEITEFGRRWDVIADRTLMILTVLAVLIRFFQEANREREIFLIFLTIAREIIAAPIALIALIKKRGIPQVRFIGKLTTFMQGFTFPFILLSIYYNLYGLESYMALATFCIGIISGFYYFKDFYEMLKKK